MRTLFWIMLLGLDSVERNMTGKPNTSPIGSPGYGIRLVAMRMMESAIIMKQTPIREIIRCFLLKAIIPLAKPKGTESRPKKPRKKHNPAAKTAKKPPTIGNLVLFCNRFLQGLLSDMVNCRSGSNIALTRALSLCLGIKVYIQPF